MTGDQGTQTAHLAKHGAPLHAVGPNGAAIDSRGGWLQPRDRSEERRVGEESRYWRDWSSDVCSSDLGYPDRALGEAWSPASRCRSKWCCDRQSGRLASAARFQRGTTSKKNGRATRSN